MILRLLYLVLAHLGMGDGMMKTDKYKTEILQWLDDKRNYEMSIYG